MRYLICYTASGMSSGIFNGDAVVAIDKALTPEMLPKLRLDLQASAPAEIGPVTITFVWKFEE